MRKHLMVVLVSLLSVSPLRAQTATPDSLLDRLIGHWVIRGPMGGKQVVHDVTFRWVLGAEYVEMHEVSREKTATGTPAYEAIVYLVHDPHTHEYAAMWLDNTDYGAFSPVGHATAAGDSIPFVFTVSPTDRIHNTFVYDRSSNTWSWHLDNETAGARRPFARVTLTRQ